MKALKNEKTKSKKKQFEKGYEKDLKDRETRKQNEKKRRKDDL